MHHDNVAAIRPDAVQHRLQVVQRMVIADRHQNAPGPHADGLPREFFPRRDIELIHFHVRRAAISLRDSLGYREHAKHDERKISPATVALGFCEQVHDRDEKKDQRDQRQSERNFLAQQAKVQRHAVFAIARDACSGSPAPPSPCIVKLQITPNAYRFARNVTSPRLAMIVRI